MMVGEGDVITNNNKKKYGQYELQAFCVNSN